jgi:hypothetical protein
MALVLADRVRETTTTAGTGTITLAGAVSGYQAFSAIGNTNTTYYTIAGQGTSEWEVGIGTYTLSGTTLSRTTVLSSSNAGSIVTFSAGTKDVFVTYPSKKSVYLDAAGNVIALGTPASGTVTNLTGTASININGTVGATTAAAGVFTTLNATTNLSSTRIDPRVSSAASASTLTPDVSAYDQYCYTALAATLTINAPTGTPLDGNKLLFRILDNGTSRTLTWNATYTVIGATLPTATTINKMTYVGCIYNAANTRWDVIGVTTQA